MDNTEKNELEKMVLAPYIQKATSLRGKYRYVGGNQFRHALGTFAILLDYHYMNPVLLKASFIHDVFEDTNCVTPDEIKYLDKDGPATYDLVMEVTRGKNESKSEFLERILVHGSTNAKILKTADRISNLTDLHTDIFDKEFIKKYIDESKRWVIPMAEQVNKEMLFELKDLIKRRETHFKMPTHFWPLTRKEDKG
jgi:(p)ppGpp synthase/HD superfamily hydrolase